MKKLILEEFADQIWPFWFRWRMLLIIEDRFSNLISKLKDRSLWYIYFTHLHFTIYSTGFWNIYFKYIRNLETSKQGDSCLGIEWELIWVWVRVVLMRRSWNVKEGHIWSFPITGLTFQVRKVMGGVVVRWVACWIILSAQVPVPFLWTLDFGFWT